jgi:nucleoside-diphosphate-sugar epimerase
MKQGRTRVLLTGATGFIGSHVLEALTREGFEVVALVRPGAKENHLQTLGAEARYGDIRDLASLRAAATGCSQVVHTAALARDWGRRQEFVETNVHGTLNVLEACRQCGIQQVVVTGSISTYGEEDSSELKDENSPSHSHYPYFLERLFPSALNYYRDSKALCTQAAIHFAQEHAMNLTVLEPAWTFGEREFGTGFYAYVKAVQNGASWMPGAAENWFQVVYAGDLAGAYVLACRKQLPGIERFIIGYGRPERMANVFSLFCQAASLPSPRMIPKWTVYPLGFALELIWTLACSRKPPPLTRGRVNTFYDSIQYSTQKATRVLGFKCSHSLEEAIWRTVGWYKANNYL